jgi:hypothetical protein
MSSQNKTSTNSSPTSKLFLQLWGILFFSLLIIAALLFRVSVNIEDMEELLRYTPPNEVGAVVSPTITSQPVEKVYVPIYSHIYSKGGKPILLESTLSIRNTDVQNDIIINEVNYYNTKGNKLKNYLKSPIKVGPLATIEYLIEKQNIKGGSGANFIVMWTSESLTNTPLIEAIMAGENDGESFSFVSRGVELEVTQKAAP